MIRRWLLVAASAIACLMVWAGTAEAATPKQLLKRYQPITVLDPQEQFAPEATNGFVADSVLQTQTAPGVWQTIDEHPTPADLRRPLTQSCIDQNIVDCYRLNQAACSPADGTAGMACYRDADQANDPRSVVYGRIAYTPNRRVLQYWYFYYDDFYSYDYPPDDLLWQAHEGDWEVVNIVLDRHTQRPLYAAYSQHCTGQRRDWADVEKVGTHPVDHIAIGSHANLFDAGTNPVATQCIPPQAVAILQGMGLPLPVDRSGDGTRYGPAGLAGVTPTRIQWTDRFTTTPWIVFGGYWGEDQVFHAPSPIGTVVSGTSPLSPGVTGLYKAPIANISRWPAG
jgi:hypothetical protein